MNCITEDSTLKVTVKAEQLNTWCIYFMNVTHDMERKKNFNYLTFYIQQICA